MRTDKAKNTGKVAVELLQNPLQTARELEETLGIGASTANRIRNELAQNGTIAKNEDILEITDTDKRIVKLAQLIVEQSLERMVELSEGRGGLDSSEALKASTMAKESTARYSLFRGKATDEDGGAKNIESIDIL